MTGTELIATERWRQINEEKWSTAHDAEFIHEELAEAAMCYINAKRCREVFFQEDAVPLRWPWEDESWKPTPNDRVRELVKAGALIAAEIDRQLKLEHQSTLKIQ